jgi:hypothetical protein
MSLSPSQLPAPSFQLPQTTIQTQPSAFNFDPSISVNWNSFWPSSDNSTSAPASVQAESNSISNFTMDKNFDFNQWLTTVNIVNLDVSTTTNNDNPTPPNPNLNHNSK